VRNRSARGARRMALGLTRRLMRSAPYAWVALAVAVALLTLLTRGVVLVLVLVAVTAERGGAAIVAAAEWADEYVSGRAGLPPLAGELGGSAR
jgi:hypothetical protein